MWHSQQPLQTTQNITMIYSGISAPLVFYNQVLPDFRGNPEFYTSTIGETTNAIIDQHSSHANLSSNWVDDTLFIGTATVIDPQSYFSGIDGHSTGQVLPQYSDINLSMGNSFDQIGDDLWNFVDGIFEDEQTAQLPSDQFQSPIHAALPGVLPSACNAFNTSPVHPPRALPKATTVPHDGVASSSTQPLSIETAPKKSLKRARECESPTPTSTSDYSPSSKSTPSLSRADDAKSCGTKGRPAKRARRGRSSVTSVPKKFKCEDSDCDFSADARGDLKRHMFSLRHKEPSFRCQIAGCDKVFTRDDALKRHMKTIPHPVKLVKSEGSAPGKEPEAKASPHESENSK